MSLLALYARVLGELGPEKRLGVVLALANILLAAVAFAEPMLFGALIDRLTTIQSSGGKLTWSAIDLLIFAWVGFGLANIGLGVFVALHADRLAHRRRLAVMATYFEHALTLPLAYHTQTHSGRVLKVMLDGASIAIRADGGNDERMRLMSRIENLDVVRSEPPARVIVNARTGTVVINGAVRVGTAAVSQGKLTVSIKESPTVVQPAPFSRGETAVEQSSDISVDQDYRPMMMVKSTASLSELVDAINRMGVPPGDLVAILEALSQAGALTAELVII